MDVEAEAAPTQRLGRVVRDRRRTLGLSQQDLAELSGASPRFVGALENGKASVRVDKLVAVLDALGLELVAELRSIS